MEGTQHFFLQEVYFELDNYLINHTVLSLHLFVYDLCGEVWVFRVKKNPSNKFSLLRIMFVVSMHSSVHAPGAYSL